MMYEPLVVQVTDRIYTKTRRHLEKARRCIGERAQLYLACVDGFPRGLSVDSVSDLVTYVLEGCVESLADKIRQNAASDKVPVSILALNQSSILPALAIQRLLGLPLRSGFIEACDKSQMRHRLLQRRADLAMQYCEAIPGEPGSARYRFSADRYVVKPAFGMSSSDVHICESWNDAKVCAESPHNAREWVPEHVTRVLSPHIGRTDKRIIEPYVDGTEFSIDGWIQDESFHAIVQHKLFMVQRTFIGDGLTVSPPIGSSRLPTGWRGLEASEEKICEFGHAILDAIGFSRGVFHIEARERYGDGKLCLIEVNPRAPGGSLWKSAMLRTGYDLELVDAAIQLGQQVPPRETPVYRNVMHYPFYAANAGILSGWGDLGHVEPYAIENLILDFVVRIGDRFYEEDMSEEPYIAFAVTHDETVEGLLKKCGAVLGLNPPRIQGCESST